MVEMGFIVSKKRSDYYKKSKCRLKSGNVEKSLMMCDKP